MQPSCMKVQILNQRHYRDSWPPCCFVATFLSTIERAGKGPFPANEWMTQPLEHVLEWMHALNGPKRDNGEEWGWAQTCFSRGWGANKGLKLLFWSCEVLPQESPRFRVSPRNWAAPSPPWQAWMGQYLWILWTCWQRCDSEWTISWQVSRLDKHFFLSLSRTLRAWRRLKLPGKVGDISPPLKYSLRTIWSLNKLTKVFSLPLYMILKPFQLSLKLRMTCLSEALYLFILNWQYEGQKVIKIWESHSFREEGGL